MSSIFNFVMKITVEDFGDLALLKKALLDDLCGIAGADTACKRFIERRSPHTTCTVEQFRRTLVFILNLPKEECPVDQTECAIYDHDKWRNLDINFLRNLKLLSQTDPGALYRIIVALEKVQNELALTSTQVFELLVEAECRRFYRGLFKVQPTTFGSLDLEGIHVEGPLSLLGSTVRGQFSLNRAHVDGPIILDNMTIGDCMEAIDVTSGSIYLKKSSVNGDINAVRHRGRIGELKKAVKLDLLHSVIAGKTITDDSLVVVKASKK